ncbi:MAG: dienelactone hydrolase family protein [Firmicutes bacterium]|nr:dienelactone hydrolase family protein [Bacillota bacterium]
MKNDRSKYFKSLAAFIVCLIIIALSVIIASHLERDFGKVKVKQIRIPITTNNGLSTYIPAKLYIPKEVNSSNPGPAVLLLHGYQNDKDTSAAFAIELARRNIVALSIDEFGHGGNPLGMRYRGYDGSISGPNRFKMFMSFSSLNHDRVEGIIDSSMGGTQAFRWLQSQEYVMADKVGITGHSMGTWSAYTIAAENPNHAAIVIQCGEVEGPVHDSEGNVTYRNVLMLQAKYDEFDYFRDYELTTKTLNETELRYKTFAGQDSPIEWNKTYGDFTNGTARRMELLNTVHRGVTHSKVGIRTAMEWFTTALQVETDIAPSDLLFMTRELLIGLALVVSLISLLPLGSFLLATDFFASVAQPIPDGYIAPKQSWRKMATISIALSAILYPFVTQLGHGLFPYPENIFKTLMAGGLILWLDFLFIISFFMFRRWYKKGEGKKLGVTMYDLGISFNREKTVLDWKIIGKTVLISALMFIYLYLLTTVSYRFLNIDLRFIWPFLRPFTGKRFLQFLLYLLFFLLFFLFNGGVKLFGQMRIKEYSTPAKTQLGWWVKNVWVMLGGLVIVALFEYVPFVLGYGTGWALTGLSLFDGPFMSALVLIFPQFLILFFIATYFYRKTGKVYLGSLVTSLIVAWITCGGAAYF